MKKFVFAAAVALMVSACGGGGGDGGNPNSPVATAPAAPAAQLAGYLGTWAADCDGREQDVATITRPAGSTDSIAIAFKTEYYAGLNCTGNIVATWTQSADVTAVYDGAIDSSIVFAAGAAAVSAKVDKVKVTLPAHTQSVVGPNVIHTVKNGRAQWCIDFGGGNSTCIYDDGAQPAASTSGGLYLRGNELFELTPSGSVYVANERYVRK